jgi:hypothetical protein
MERVLRAFELTEDGRRRRAYVTLLEAPAANAGGMIDEEARRRSAVDRISARKPPRIAYLK